jgi:hypothetical protein
MMFAPLLIEFEHSYAHQPETIPPLSNQSYQDRGREFRSDNDIRDHYLRPVADTVKVDLGVAKSMFDWV